MKTVKYKIEGICPVLFHNVNSMDLVKPKAMTHAEFEDSKEMFNARLYLENDKLTIPPRMIMGLLKTAAQRSGIKQDGKRATYSNIIRAVVFCLEPIFLKEKIEDVFKYKEYVTVNNSKVLRIFPSLKKWSGTLELQFDEKQISLEVLDELLGYGGNFLGFGDYRPQFGRFEIARIK